MDFLWNSPVPVTNFFSSQNYRLYLLPELITAIINELIVSFIFNIFNSIRSLIIQSLVFYINKGNTAHHVGIFDGKRKLLGGPKYLVAQVQKCGLCVQWHPIVWQQSKRKCIHIPITIFSTKMKTKRKQYLLLFFIIYFSILLFSPTF